MFHVLYCLGLLRCGENVSFSWPTGRVATSLRLKLSCGHTQRCIQNTVLNPSDHDVMFGWQGAELMSEEEIANLPDRDWNPTVKPSLSTWLTQEQTDSQKSRLHALGNIVMPGMENLALNLIGLKLKAHAN